MTRALAGLATLTSLFLLLLWHAGVFRAGRIGPGERSSEPAVAAGRPLLLVATETPVIYRAVGTIRSRDEIELSSRITARIVAMPFRGGDAVPSQEVLVRLDDADLRAAVARAAERARAAAADLKLAETELARSRQLFERQAIPQRNLDLAERNFDATRAEAAGAAEGHREAEANLEHATIRAPMAAVVADRLADPGDMASPGKILIKVFDPTRLMLHVPLRESLVGQVKVGDRLHCRVEALARDFAGEIREIVPSVDEGSRTFLVKICLDEVAGLMPGMFGALALEVGREPAVLAPAEAIRTVGQLEHATVLDQDQRPQPRLVRTVPGPDAQTRRVASGLVAGETILVPEPLMPGKQ